MWRAFAIYPVHPSSSAYTSLLVEEKEEEKYNRRRWLMNHIRNQPTIPTKPNDYPLLHPRSDGKSGYLGT